MKELGSLIPELTLVKKVTGRRPDYLFTFVATDGRLSYIASCMHGNRDGSLYLEGRKGITVKATELRQLVCDFYQYPIPEGAYLFITPCYPGSVKHHRGAALAKRGIMIIGNWFRTTYFHVKESGEGWSLNCYTR